jgi:hypothetical protein
MINNNEIIGDIQINVDVTLTLEYEGIKWFLVFAKTESTAYFL